MLENARSLKAISLTGMIVTGALLGFYWQKIADSGQLQFRRIAVSCILSVGSYVVAFLLIEARTRTRASSEWLLAAIVGSLLSAFNLRVLKLVFQSVRDPYSPPISEQLYHIGVGFLACAVIYIVVAIVVISTIHFLVREVVRLSD